MHLRKEFKKWNDRLNTASEGEERDNAQKMLDLIADARENMADITSVAHAMAEKVRYSGDTLRRTTDGDSSRTGRLRNQFYHDGLRISPLVTPALASGLKLVCQRLHIPEGAVEAFIFASPELQAECFAGGASNCVLRFSSSLVDLLDDQEFEFVAGHEIGHFLLGHGIVKLQSQGDSLECLIEQRRQEISVDRMGLIACQKLETAIGALMKTVSGLSSEHLRFDVGAFISQLRDAQEAQYEDAHFATHPASLIRCRALLWFSLNDFFTRGADDFNEEQMTKLDQRIENDFERFVDGPAKHLIKVAKEELAIWIAAQHAVQEGAFDKNEQAVISDLFGSEILDRLKIFLSGLPASEVQDIVYQRMKSAREDLERMIPSSLEDILEEIQRDITAKLN